ncbi:hypothetical protein D3C71_1783640 [compost metagenome]
MALHQQPARLDDILCLAVVQADRLDVVRQALYTECMDCRWGIGDRKQPGRGLVHADVRGLGGEDHRNQQFEGGGIGQLGFRFRIVFVKPAENFQTFCGIHGQSSSLKTFSVKLRCQARLVWLPGAVPAE